MSKKPWKLIRSKMHESPDLRVGKKGISTGVIAEANHLLKKKKVIKVKFLRSSAASKDEVKTLSHEIAKRSNAKIGKIIGRTAILYRDAE